MPKYNRFKNRKVEVDGIKFDSKKEAGRYIQLKKLADAGIITDLVLQPQFEICPGGAFDPFTGRRMRARYYKADFQYKEAGITVVEDVKSPATRKEPLYRLKRQLFLVRFGDKVIFRET